MINSNDPLTRAIEEFNRKFNVKSPFEWIERIERLEVLVDSVRVVKPINWLKLPDDTFEYRLYVGRTSSISPVQAWEQNHEKISKYFPDFSKADLPIQVAFTKCFFYRLSWIGRDLDCLGIDYDYTSHPYSERLNGVIPIFHYLDEAEPKKAKYRQEYYTRKIFKGRAKGSLAVGFLSGVEVLDDLLNNQKKDDFFFYWTDSGIIRSRKSLGRDCSIDVNTLIKINTELYEAYHNSENPYNKKLINDVLLLAKELMPICKFIHIKALERFMRSNKDSPVQSFIDSYKDLKAELTLTNEEIIRKYEESLARTMKSIKENKSEEDSF